MNFNLLLLLLALGLSISAVKPRSRSRLNRAEQAEQYSERLEQRFFNAEASRAARDETRREQRQEIERLQQERQAKKQEFERLREQRQRQLDLLQDQLRNQNRDHIVQESPRRVSASRSPSPEIAKCIICNDESGQGCIAMLKRCLHRFCTECISQFDNRRCPICRSEFGDDDIKHKIE